MIGERTTAPLWRAVVTLAVLDLRLGVNRIKSDNEADVIENYDYDAVGIPAARLPELVGARLERSVRPS